MLDSAPRNDGPGYAPAGQYGPPQAGDDYRQSQPGYGNEGFDSFPGGNPGGEDDDIPF
jgi:hypothetical protein